MTFHFFKQNLHFSKKILVICISVLGLQDLFGQGVQHRQVLLGGHLPLSQKVGDIAKGADAYFQYINEQGGVHGRLIRYQYHDDRFNPEIAQQIAHDLVLNEEVFAMFGSVETQPSLVKWISQMEVPNLFLASRMPELANTPLALTFMPSLKTESRILSRYLATQYPRQSIVIWSRQDNHHQALAKILAKELKMYRIQVKVLKHSKFLQKFHEESLKIKKSQADILVVFSTPDVSTQIISQLKKGKPSQIYLGYDTTFPKGITKISTKKIFTLGNLPFTNHLENKSVKLHHRLLQAYFPKTEPSQWTIYGHASAESMVNLLSQAGRNLDRQGFLKLAYSFQNKRRHIAPPIHAINTLHWIDSMRIAEMKNGSFVFVSPWIQAL